MEKKDSRKKKKNEHRKKIEQAGITGASGDVVNRYGAGVKEHIVAYNGKDNETGQTMSKSLKSISKSKTNPDTHDQNVKQQAGFSAEVKSAARENAEKAISGNSGSKTSRTDDMAKQTDGNGHTVGGTNDQLYDLAEVDKNGIYVEGSGRQLKFIGGTPDECADKLLQKKFDKYRDADVPIEVPSDYYDRVQERLSEKEAALNKQIERAEKQGNKELAAKKRQELKRVQQTKRNLKKSNVSSEEALEARLHPKLSTAKDIVRVSHRAGLENAKNSAIVGGGMALIRHSVAVLQGDEEPDEALAGIAADTAGAAALGYGTGAAGSLIKGCMQNAPVEMIRRLSETNLPATIVTVTVQTGKTIGKWIAGEIDGTECLTELGQDGTGMLASAATATVGQEIGGAIGAALGTATLPLVGTITGAVVGKILGGLLGGMFGYSISTSYYQSLMSVLHGAKLAHEERLIIERECAAAERAAREYRIRLEIAINNYLTDYRETFATAMNAMSLAYEEGDADGFIAGANRITEKLGGNAQFHNKSEFDALMSSDLTFVL